MLPAMRVNRPSEPSYAGLGTFDKLPLILEPSELKDADVAILGAPIDETTVGRPGTRFGPRAIRLADPAGAGDERPHMDLGVDPYEALTVVDHGDAEVVPADAARSHEAIRHSVRDILRAGAFPVVLGGDHSILHPDAGAAADHFGKGSVGLIHFDAHADDAESLHGVRRSHGTPVRLLVEEGSVRGEHTIQVGLRGYWPGPEEFAWAREQGLVWFTQGEIDERGFEEVVEETLRLAGRAQRAWLSVDIDVVDPGSAPGTGAPEPGGLTPRELLRAVRRIGREVELCGLEVVEVSPPYDQADVTALLAHRVVLETLSGLALRRQAREPAPERPRSR
jgi:agmatinase